MVSCTRFFLYKFLAPNTAQFYSIQETCIHVTRMVSSDWSAAYRCHVFSLLFSRHLTWPFIYVVDNLLYKVNIVCLLIYFLTYLSYSSKNSVFPCSGRQKVLRKLFVSSKNARFYLMCCKPNLHELAQKFDARNAQVSWLCVTTISEHRLGPYSPLS